MDWISAHRSRVYDIVRLVSSRLARPASRLSRSKCTPRLSRLRLRFRRIPLLSREFARLFVPRAAVLARPLQHLEVVALRRFPARLLVPRAVVRARHFSTSRWPPLAAYAPSSSPRTCILARPLQHLEVAAIRRERARPLVPRAAVLARPLQHVEVAALRRGPACPLVPRKFSARRGAFSASRSPIRAAARQRRRSSDSRPRRRRPRGVLRYPRRAASYSLNSSTFRPVASTASRMPLLTARSTARSSGSGGCFSRDGEVEGQGRKSDARLRVEVPLSLARARLDAARRVADHRGWCRVRRARRRAAPRASLCVPRPRSEILVVVVRFRRNAFS